MLDIKFIRQNPEKVKEGCRKKGVKCNIDQILKLDEERRKYISQVESLRAKQKKLGRAGIKEAQEIKSQIKQITPTLEKTEIELNHLMLQIPNLPLEGVPEGKDESDNVVLREEGKKPKFSFKPKDYLTIAEKLDLIDIKRAAKVSGTRFGYIKGKAALLEFALVNLAFDVLVKEGFTPIIPPVMLKSEMARGMGYLEQADEQEAYCLPQDDLCLVGTAEQSIGVMHANEVLQEKELPRRYVGFSTCFRREAGSYGKDTRGIFRVHQFDKVEMFSFSHPEKCNQEHKFLLKMQEKLMKALKIPYRVIYICAGDLGMPASCKYDIEAWLPSENNYRETHSTSNCTDFQSRRLNIRYRGKKGLEFVHTLNGTAFAVGRMIISIIENYQQKDGSIEVPKVLQKYTKFKKIS